MTTPTQSRPAFDPPEARTRPPRSPKSRRPPPDPAAPVGVPPAPPDAPGFRRRTYSIPEAAALLGVGDEAIRLACQRGTILVDGEAVPFRSLQVGSRRVIPRHAVHTLLGEIDQRVEALAPADVLAAARRWRPVDVLQVGRQLVELGAEGLAAQATADAIGPPPLDTYEAAISRVDGRKGTRR